MVGTSLPPVVDAVVLGGTGLLGQALSRQLHVRGLSNVSWSRSAKQPVDLCDDAALLSALAQTTTGLIINAAAMVDVPGCEQDVGAAYRINARVPAQLAAYCTRRGIRLVQVSTDHFHRGPINVLHDEDATVELVNEYARTKFAGEGFALTCPHALVVRTNIVGFRHWPGRPTFVEWAIDALTRQQPFTAYDNVWASSIDADACAAVILDLAVQGKTGRFNVGSANAHSKAEFISTLATALKLDASHIRVANVDPRATPPRANAMGLDVQRVERALGRPQPTLRQVIANLIDAKGQAHHGWH